MANPQLRKNPETGETFFWEEGAADWTKVEARRNPDTGEVHILPQGGSAWRSLGQYSPVTAPQRAPRAEARPQSAGGIPPSLQPDVDALAAALAGPTQARNFDLPATMSPAGLNDPVGQIIASMAPPPAAVAPVRQAPGPVIPPDLADMIAAGGYAPPAAPALPPMQGPAQPDPFAGEGFGALLKRRGQQAAAGAADVPASIPEAAAIAGRGITEARKTSVETALPALAAEKAQLEATIQQFGPDAPQGRAAAMRLQNVDLQIAAASRMLGEDQMATATPLDQTGQFKAGQVIRDAMAGVVGAPDPRDTGFWGQLASGAGNMAGFVATSLLGGGAGVAATGSAMNAAQVYKEAVQSGASDDDARRAAGMAGVVGLSEAIPVERALKALPRGLREAAATTIGNRVASSFRSAGEEGAQEAFQGVMNNLIAAGIYDPERGVWEDVPEQALIGAILGGGVNVVGQGIAGGEKSSAAIPPKSGGTAELPPTAPQPPADVRAPVAAPKRPDRPEPEAAPEPPLSAGAPAPFEDLDEVETDPDDPQARIPTGRRVRMDLATGRATVLEDEESLPSPGSGGEDAGRGAPEIGTGVPPAPDGAPEGQAATPLPANPTPRQNPTEARADGEHDIEVTVLRNGDIEQIGAEPGVFQYKGGGDEAGVTDRLRGVKSWDPIRSGMAIVYEYEDGRRVVADGHQRLGLAKRLSAEGQRIQQPAIIIRQADGYSPEDGRTLAALKNIAEGSGDAIDAAKILRTDPKGVDALNLPPKSALVRDATGLAGLSPDAFGMVVNERASVRDGALVGQIVSDQKVQADILSLLGRLKPKNAFQAEQIARQAAAETTTETQTSLFGDEQVATSLYAERAKVLDATLAYLKQNAKLFRTLVENDKTIQSAGNVLDRRANESQLDADRRVQEYLLRLANSKGPISDALGNAARSLKAGTSPGQARAEFLAALRRILAEDGAAGRDDGPAGPDVQPDRRDQREGGPGAVQQGAAQAVEAPPEPQTERTPEGEQALIPGVAPITDRQRAEAQMAKPKTGTDKGPGSGRDDLFGNPEDRRDLFDAAPRAKESPDDQPTEPRREPGGVEDVPARDEAAGARGDRPEGQGGVPEGGRDRDDADRPDDGKPEAAVEGPKEQRAAAERTDRPGAAPLTRATGATGMAPDLAPEIMRDLRARLDAMDLKRVGLGMDRSGRWRQGATEIRGPGMIDILIGHALDPLKTLYHESIHALRALNLFTDAEWSALVRAAAKGWVEKHKIAERYPELLPSEQIEEAIAEEFAEHAAKKTEPRANIIGRAYRKTVRFIKAIRDILTGRELTAEEVFDRAFWGELQGRNAGNSGQKQRMEAWDQAAYHGTPHDFDRFSTEHIGTGEGAQVYGWGMYFAGKRAVAEHYRNALADSAPSISVDGKRVTAGRMPHGKRTAAERAVVLVSDVLKDGADIDTAIRHARSFLRRAEKGDLTEFQREAGWGDVDKLREVVSVLDGWRGKHIEQGKGRLYTVEVPDDADLLIWDKPLNEQPEAVKEALEALLSDIASGDSPRGNADAAYGADALLNDDWDMITGEDLYEGMKRFFGEEVPDSGWTQIGGVTPGSDRETSLALRDAGIPGHRYLDGGSRGAGDGSYNYVIYDESAVSVTAKEQRMPAPFVGAAQRQAIADVFAGKKLDETIAFPETPAVLQALGLKNTPLIIRQSVLWKGNADKHGMTEDQIVEALNGLTDPVMVFDSATMKGALVSLVEVPGEARPVVVAVHPEEKVGRIEIKTIASVHRKDSAGQILAWMDQGLTRYFNKRKAEAWVRPRGLYLPKSGSPKHRLGKKVLQHRDVFKGGPETREQRMPAQARAHAATAMAHPAHIPERRVFEELSRNGATMWERIGGGAGAARDAVDKARVVLQDRFLPVLRAQEAVMKETGRPLPIEQDAYVAEATFSGKVGRHLFEIDEDFTKPIADLIGRTKGGLTVDAVGRWLTARHAAERNAYIASINPKMPDGGAGMATAEAQQILADAAAGPHAAALQQIGDLIDRLRDRTLDLRHDAGLLSDEERAIWKTQYRHYVPLKGFAETDHSEAVLDVTGIGKRFNTRGQESKQALGRKSEAFNPLVAAIVQAQEVAIRAEKNRVGQALYSLVKENPAPAMWEAKTPQQKRVFNRTTGLVETRVEPAVSLFMDPNEMAVKVGGKEHRILFHDPRLARAAGTVGADRMNMIVSLLSKFGRYFSAINTMLNPEFVISNAFRDMQTAQINIQGFGQADKASIAKSMIKNWPRAWRAAFRGLRDTDPSGEWGQWFKEYQKAGAQVSFWNMDQPEAQKLMLERMIADRHGSFLRRRLKYLRFSDKDNPILSGIERVNLAVDNAIRLAAFVEARKRGWPVEKAAYLAKNLTVNFNRRGEVGPTLNATWVFFNAALQGTQIMAHALTHRRVLMTVAGIMAMAFLNDLANATWSADDEDGEKKYDKIPDYKQQMNMVSVWAPVGEGNALTLPMPYGYNVFWYAGTQMGKVYRGVKEPGEALAGVFGAMLKAFSPISGESFGATVMPTILDPVNEMATNQDWLGRPIRPEDPWRDYGPDAYKFYGGASDWAKWAADTANRATGGDEARSGWLDVSPEYLDHTFNFLTGGVGRFLSNAFDTMGKLMSGRADEIEAYRIPFYRKLITDMEDSRADVDRFYRFKGEVEEAKDAAASYRDVGKPVPKDIAALADLADNELARIRDRVAQAAEEAKTLRNTGQPVPLATAIGAELAGRTAGQMRSKVAEAQATADAMKAAGEKIPDEIRALTALATPKKDKELNARSPLTKATEELERIRGERDAAYADKDKTAAEKSAKLKQLKAEERAAVIEFNKAYISLTGRHGA